MCIYQDCNIKVNIKKSILFLHITNKFNEKCARLLHLKLHRTTELNLKGTKYMKRYTMFMD